MLLRVTNKCHGGCSHCMIDSSGPDGEHMSAETFDKVLGFLHRTNTPAVLVSGGEPFEHPHIFSIINKLSRRGYVFVASNGHFILDDELTERIRSSGVAVQVTCDPRYYGKKLDRYQFLEPQFHFEDSLGGIFPCRRTKEAGLAPSRQSPMCFNIRSATRARGFVDGVVLLTRSARICSPSINVDGTVRAGETDTCHQIGTVDSTLQEIEMALVGMRCGKCGTGGHLDSTHLAAIGGEI